MAWISAREQLLNGQQIQMGDLGVFSNSIRSLGAPSMAEFTVENITEVNVLWAPGVRFNNLRQDAEFQLVPTRKAAAEVVKALKAGKTTVDLTGNSSAAGIAADDADASRIPAASGEPADENS
jgi:hypothetical protein